MILNLKKLFSRKLHIIFERIIFRKFEVFTLLKEKYSNSICGRYFFPVCTLEWDYSWSNSETQTVILKLHNPPTAPKVVKKVLTNLGLSKAPGLGSIPVEFLKNCETELSCVPSYLFNMCLKESCFPDCL